MQVMHHTWSCMLLCTFQVPCVNVRADVYISGALRGCMLPCTLQVSGMNICASVIRRLHVAMYSHLDMTFTVDWALKINYLSIRVHCRCQCLGQSVWQLRLETSGHTLRTREATCGKVMLVCSSIATRMWPWISTLAPGTMRRTLLLFCSTPCRCGTA